MSLNGSPLSEKLTALAMLIADILQEVEVPERLNSSPLGEHLTALGNEISQMLENPGAPRSLKIQLQNFTGICRNDLPDNLEEEIEIIEARILLPEILIRLNQLG